MLFLCFFHRKKRKERSDEFNESPDDLFLRNRRKISRSLLLSPETHFGEDVEPLEVKILRGYNNRRTGRTVPGERSSLRSLLFYKPPPVERSRILGVPRDGSVSSSSSPMIHPEDIPDMGDDYSREILGLL